MNTCFLHVDKAISCTAGCSAYDGGSPNHYCRLIRLVISTNMYVDSLRLRLDNSVTYPRSPPAPEVK